MPQLLMGLHPYLMPAQEGVHRVYNFCWNMVQKFNRKHVFLHQLMKQPAEVSIKISRLQNISAI